MTKTYDDLVARVTKLEAVAAQAIKLLHEFQAELNAAVTNEQLDTLSLRIDASTQALEAEILADAPPVVPVDSPPAASATHTTAAEDEAR